MKFTSLRPGQKSRCLLSVSGLAAIAMVATAIWTLVPEREALAGAKVDSTRGSVLLRRSTPARVAEVKKSAPQAEAGQQRKSVVVRSTSPSTKQSVRVPSQGSKVQSGSNPLPLDINVPNLTPQAAGTPDVEEPRRRRSRRGRFGRRRDQAAVTSPTAQRVAMAPPAAHAQGTADYGFAPYHYAAQADSPVRIGGGEGLNIRGAGGAGAQFGGLQGFRVDGDHGTRVQFGGGQGFRVNGSKGWGVQFGGGRGAVFGPVGTED